MNETHSRHHTSPKSLGPGLAQQQNTPTGYIVARQNVICAPVRVLLAPSTPTGYTVARVSLPRFESRYRTRFSKSRTNPDRNRNRNSNHDPSPLMCPSYDKTPNPSSNPNPNLSPSPNLTLCLPDTTKYLSLTLTLTDSFPTPSI